MADLVWMKHEFPWLGGGFVHAVAHERVEEFVSDLGRLGFSIIRVEGETIADERTFWLEVKRAFEFPDYFSSNWDAFNDCFGDLSLPGRLAVTWRRADVTGRTSLKLLVEAVTVLERTAEAVQPLGTQLVVAISGEGPGFARPRP